MVRVTSYLLRIPVIKFRKGGSQTASAGSASSAPAAAKPSPSVQSQPAAAMSSATISDIDLPPRYRRLPLSQEEIDHINGGGVV